MWLRSEEVTDRQKTTWLKLGNNRGDGLKKTTLTAGSKQEMNSNLPMSESHSLLIHLFTQTALITNVLPSEIIKIKLQ